jgi:hypothetical protein
MGTINNARRPSVLFEPQHTNHIVDTPGNIGDNSDSIEFIGRTTVARRRLITVEQRSVWHAGVVGRFKAVVVGSQGRCWSQC